MLVDVLIGVSFVVGLVICLAVSADDPDNPELALVALGTLVAGGYLAWKLVVVLYGLLFGLIL